LANDAGRAVTGVRDGAVEVVAALTVDPGPLGNIILKRPVEIEEDAGADTNHACALPLTAFAVDADGVDGASTIDAH
jgi:hypothetical protein